MTERTRSMRGMRVIEFADVMDGPVCGLMRADKGAEVIKLEKRTETTVAGACRPRSRAKRSSPG